MPTESGIILPSDSTGKALRTETVTTAFVSGSGGVVHQQIVSLGDPTTPANLATVGPEGGLWVVPRGGVRHIINWNVEAYSVTASEAAPTMTRSTDLAATTTTGSNPYVVTTGKTLRLQGISISGVLLGTTVTASRVIIRAAASGTAGTGSPIQFSTRLGNASVGTQAANYGLIQQDIDFADGLEFPSASSFIVTAIASTAAMHSLDISLWGYEYP
jgi:hypothetical protein